MTFAGIRNKITKVETITIVFLSIFVVSVVALFSFSSESKVYARSQSNDIQLSEVIWNSFQKKQKLQALQKINPATKFRNEKSFPYFYNYMEEVMTGERDFSSVFNPKSSNMVEQDISTITNDFKGLQNGFDVDSFNYSESLELAIELYVQNKPMHATNLTEENRINLNEANNLLLISFSKNPKHSNTDYVLYLLSDIGFILWDEAKGMEGAFYAIYLIKNYPSSDLSRMAWVNLRDYVHFSYSGSNGVKTPRDWKLFLEELYKVAFD